MDNQLRQGEAGTGRCGGSTQNPEHPRAELGQELGAEQQSLIPEKKKATFSAVSVHVLDMDNPSSRKVQSNIQKLVSDILLKLLSDLI